MGMIYVLAGPFINCCFQCRRSTAFVRRAFVVCLHTLINRMLSFSFPLIFFLSFILIVEAGQDLHNPNASESSHTNNWAVLVCASRYWFNYRVRIVGPLDVSCT